MSVLTFVVLMTAVAVAKASVIPEVESLAAADARNLNIHYEYSKGTASETVSSGQAPAGFAMTDPTYIIVHGHRGSSRDEFSTTVSRAINNKDPDAQIFVMNWSSLASATYNQAVRNVETAASDLKLLIETLGNTDIHIVGFDLGAHLAGRASRGDQVDMITGLDPAGRNWGDNSGRLTRTDALYVEVIHTDGGILGSGIGTEIGNLDFFVNGGSNQPGCLTNSCNHNRAWEVYASTIDNAATDDSAGRCFGGKYCLNSAQMTFNQCSGGEACMGGLEHDNKVTGIDGIYRVNTGSRYPF